MRRAMVRTVVISTALVLIMLCQAGAEKRPTPSKASKTQCCDEVRSLKVQVANLTSLLVDLTRKQEDDRMNLVRQVMELEKRNQQQEARVTEAESKYSEIHNRVEIMQFQAAQAPSQTTSGKTNEDRGLPHGISPKAGKTPL